MKLFDRRLRVYNPPRSEFLTRDKKNLSIDSYALWQIADPEAFVQTVGNEQAAEMRLHDLVWSGLQAAIAGLDLEEIVSTSPDLVKTDAVLDDLAQRSGTETLKQYGIRVADVRLKRLNLPEQNKQSVYARMRAERERIARQYRAEGEEQALRIRAEADRMKEEILAKAYKEAESTKGEGDAAATRIYGAAHSRNQSLYKLTRTLETYRKALDEDTTVILSADSELLRLLTRGAIALQCICIPRYLPTAQSPLPRIRPARRPVVRQARRSGGSLDLAAHGDICRADGRASGADDLRSCNRRSRHARCRLALGPGPQVASTSSRCGNLSGPLSAERWQMRPTPCQRIRYFAIPHRRPEHSECASSCPVQHRGACKLPLPCP